MRRMVRLCFLPIAFLGCSDSGKYTGDILHFRVLGDSFVALGSASVVMEYLDKGSANTSDRKESVLIEL